MHPIGHAPQVFNRVGMHQQQEFFTAPANGMVFCANYGSQRLRCVLQHDVADIMAIAVVDALEIIEVDQDHAQHVRHARQGAAPPQAGQHAGNLLLGEAAVAHAGQRIGQAGLLQRMVQVFQVGVGAAQRFGLPVDFALQRDAARVYLLEAQLDQAHHPQHGQQQADCTHRTALMPERFGAHVQHGGRAPVLAVPAGLRFEVEVARRQVGEVSSVAPADLAPFGLERRHAVAVLQALGQVEFAAFEADLELALFGLQAQRAVGQVARLAFHVGLADDHGGHGGRRHVEARAHGTGQAGGPVVRRAQVAFVAPHAIAAADAAAATHVAQVGVEQLHHRRRIAAFGRQLEAEHAVEMGAPVPAVVLAKRADTVRRHAVRLQPAPVLVAVDGVDAVLVGADHDAVFAVAGQGHHQRLAEGACRLRLQLAALQAPQALGRAHPQDAVFAFVEGADGAGQLGAEQARGLAGGAVDRVQALHGGGQQLAVGALEQGVDLDAVELGDVLELAVLQAQQAVAGADPQAAFAVFEQGVGDLVLELGRHEERFHAFAVGAPDALVGAHQQAMLARDVGPGLQGLAVGFGLQRAGTTVPVVAQAGGEAADPEVVEVFGHHVARGGQGRGGAGWHRCDEARVFVDADVARGHGPQALVLVERQLFDGGGVVADALGGVAGFGVPAVEALGGAKPELAFAPLQLADLEAGLPLQRQFCYLVAVQGPDVAVFVGQRGVGAAHRQRDER